MAGYYYNNSFCTEEMNEMVLTLLIFKYVLMCLQTELAYFKIFYDCIDLETLLECPVGATDIMLEDSSPNFLGK